MTLKADIHIAPGALSLVCAPTDLDGMKALADILMGSIDGSRLIAGRIALFERDLTPLSPEDRALAGLFRLYADGLPAELTMPLTDYLRDICRLHQPTGFDLRAFHQRLAETKKLLGIPGSLSACNEDERRSFDYLQCALVDPQVIILDAPDERYAPQIQRARAQGRMILAFTAAAKDCAWIAPTTSIDGDQLFLWDDAGSVGARERKEADSPKQQESAATCVATRVEDAIAQSTLKDPSQKGEPVWLTQLRLEALHHLQKFANEKAATPCSTGFAPRRLVADSSPPALSHHLSGVTTLWNEIQRQGGFIGKMEDGLLSKGSLVKRYLGSLTQSYGDWPEWLNMAQWQTGNLIHLPRNALPHFVIEQPLGALGLKGERVTRTLIIADEGASFTYIDGCAAREQRANHHGIRLATTEIFLAKGAKVEVVSLAHFDGTMGDRSRKFVRVASGAELKMTEVIFDPADTILPPVVQLEGPDASFIYRQLLVLSRGQQRVPLGVQMARRNSLAQPSTGKVVIQARVIAGNGSSVTCDGLVRPLEAHDTALKWQADLRAVLWDTDSDLWLSDKPQRNWSEPGFGLALRTDPAALIAYLRSRGLPPPEAMALIGESIAADIMADLPMEYAIEIRRFFLT